MEGDTATEVDKARGIVMRSVEVVERVGSSVRRDLT